MAKVAIAGESSKWHLRTCDSLSQAFYSGCVSNGFPIIECIVGEFTCSDHALLSTFWDAVDTALYDSVGGATPDGYRNFRQLSRAARISSCSYGRAACITASAGN